MEIKDFIVGFLTRWILKAAGGFFLGLGYTTESTEAFIFGVLTFVAGIVISLVQQKKAINTPPPR